MIAINFAPPKYVKKIFSSIIVAKIIFVSLIVIIIVCGVSVLHYIKYNTLFTENQILTNEYKRLSSEVELSKKVEREISEIEGYINHIQALSRNRYIYVAFMQDLVNNLPPTVWFSGIETRSQSDFIDVRINVNSNNLEDLLWWYSFIENNKNRYSDSKITTINYAGDYYTTQISFKYRYKV